MSPFSVAQALAICTANLNNRAKSKTTAYLLYMTNSQSNYDNVIEGTTIKELINKFRAEGSQYKYAYITRKNENKVLRFFNRSEGKQFFSMTRVGGKRKVK